MNLDKFKVLFRLKEKQINYRDLLVKKLSKLNDKDLFFIRTQVNIELKKRGVLRCSK